MNGVYGLFRTGLASALALIAGALVGCASSSSYDDQEYGPNADPIVYDSFVVSRPMPTRQPNDFEFYYKHCQQEVNRPGGWSVTSYDCTTSAF